MRYFALVFAALFVVGAAHAAEDMSSNAMNGDATTVASEPGMQAPFAYSEWDSNADDAVDEEEFYVGYEESGMFDEWDANDDGVLDEDEFGGGWFDTWDTDDNGVLDQDDTIAESGSSDR